MKKFLPKNILLALLFFTSISVLIFWKFYFKGDIPFPGNFLIAWFEPWRSEHFSNGTILIANKPVAEDVIRQLIPFKSLAVDMVKNFTAPLWNPYNGAGMPLLATINIGFLNPFNILFLILPFYFAWGLHIAIQPIVIGISTFLYSKKIKLSNLASIFTSTALVFSGFVATRLIFEVYGLAIAILPLLLYLIEDFFQNVNSRKIFILPFLLFSLIVSTQPQITLYVILFSGIYFIFKMLSLTKKTINYKNLLKITFLGVTGIGLSAIQLLPTLELFKNSGVNTEASKLVVEKFLVPLPHLVTILIPNYFGNPGTYNYFGGTDYAQTVASVGLIACFFAFFALRKYDSKKDIRIFYVFSVFIASLLAINWIGAKLFLSLPIPLLSTGAPSRIFFLTTFSIAILAGFGFDRWVNLERKNLKNLFYRLIPFLGLIFLISLVTFILYYIHFPCNNLVIKACRTVSLRNTILEIFVFGIFLIPLVTYLIAGKNYILKKVLPISIILITIFVGYYNSTKYMPFSPSSSFFPKTELSQFLTKHAQEGRAFGIGNASISTDIASYLKFYDTNYYHPLFIEKYRELVNYVNTGVFNQNLERGDIEINNQATPSGSLEKRRERLFQLLGVKYLFFSKNELPANQTNENIAWQNDNFYVTKIKTQPRAYFVNKFGVIKKPDKILERLFNDSFNYQASVILEKNQDTTFSDNITGNIEKIDYRENQVFLRTKISDNSILVLSDNYYPGWKAYIDGRETKIYRANYTFRAIIVPKGEHTIIFSYEPNSFKYGVYISIISLLGILLFYFLTENHILKLSSK